MRWSLSDILFSCLSFYYKNLNAKYTVWFSSIRIFVNSKGYGLGWWWWWWWEGEREGGPSLHLTSALPNQIHAQTHVRTASYSSESLWKYRAFVSLLNKPLYSKLCKLLGVPQGHKDRDISPTVTRPPSGDTHWYLGQWLMRSEVRMVLFTWLELLPTKLLALVISASK